MPTIFSHPAKSLARLAALGVVLGTLPGCQSIQGTVNNGAAIRFVNASTDISLPGLDMYQGTTVLVYNLGSGFITSYVPTTPGTYTYSAQAHDTHQVLVSTKQTLVAPKQYTAIIGNIAASLQQTILVDQTSAAPTGQISMRFLDQSTRTGAVDLYLVPAAGKLMTTTPVATNVAFNGNTGYINVPADTYAIAIVPTGTVPISTTITLYTGASTAYAAGAARTYILIDSTITTTPALKVIEAKDYDSPTATI